MSSSFDLRPLIEKKKRELALSKSEIESWIRALVAGRIPDYQSAALLMAICLKGMDFDETLALTEAMVASGDRLAFPGYATLGDKHSTGGVGDKVSLILAPMLAAAGLPVTMLSGRGLGHTGGTIDKFESLPGVSCNLDQRQMKEMLDRVGWTNACASQNIVPADRILYALRDVTATVDSIPLITASILSKKIAGGATHLCLDVKCGSGAFMRTKQRAMALSENLRIIGNRSGMAVFGLISRMDEPLGHAVGNYLELLEAVAYLREPHDTPLMRLVYALGVKLLLKTGVEKTAQNAEQRMRATIQKGAALEKLLDYLRFAGADAAALDRLPRQGFDDLPRRPVLSGRAGEVRALDGYGLGTYLIELGAGRRSRKDRLDYMAGVYLAKHVGDRVEKGDVLAWVYGERGIDGGDAVSERIDGFFSLDASSKPPKPLILHEF